MANLNKNILLNQLQELIESNIEKNSIYLPNSFNIKQAEAFETFKKRIFLENIIDETIDFNKNLNWENRFENLKLTTTAEDLIEVFKLRSKVYHQIRYQKECPDTIENLNFDIFDKKSAVLYYQREREITGTCRLIFDSENKLPSEEKLTFNSQRKNYGTIGEISRNIVKNRGQGLNLEFKYLMAGVYDIFINNNIGLTLSGIRKDHLKLFSKFGGIEVIHELEKYGEVDIPFLIISWNPNLASKFFKKVFLNE